MPTPQPYPSISATASFPLNEEDAEEPTRLIYFDLNDLDED
jgi:hypothetical protein